MALKNHIAIKEWKKYVVTLIITVAIFATAIGISMWIDNARVTNIKSLQDDISLNILSSETQYNLLKDANCNDLFNSDLATQLSDMGDRLSYMESTGHGNDTDFISLKQYYYLLEIKDYMLVKSASKCPLRPATVLYFYQPNCPECDKQGDVLTYLRQHFPDNIRVYSFDDSLKVPAVQTLEIVNKVLAPLPVIVLDGKSYKGFQSVDDIAKLDPKISSPRIRLVLSPHLDDAAVSVGGLLAKAANSTNYSGANSPIIATVFSGTPKMATSTSWDTNSGFENSSEAMPARLSENVNAADILGSQAENLGYLDKQYRNVTATTSLEKKIAADIIELIRKYDNGTSSLEIYGPAIFSEGVGHDDHTILHEAYMRVISQYIPKGVVTFFIYEDFPYAKEAGVPKTNLIDILKDDAPQFSYTPIYIPLSNGIVSTKENAIRAYSSQLKAFNAVGLDLASSSLNWTNKRCNGLFRIPSACEVVYRVQK